MLSFLYVYSDHSILECYNLFSGVELSMRSFFVISAIHDGSTLILVVVPEADLHANDYLPKTFLKH